MEEAALTKSELGLVSAPPCSLFTRYFYSELAELDYFLGRLIRIVGLHAECDVCPPPHASYFHFIE